LFGLTLCPHGVELLAFYAAAYYQSQDVGGGTVITYAPPTFALVLAAGH
jgi:hypothetical protein